MPLNAYLQIAAYFAVLLALAKPLGTYIARVYQRQPVLIDPAVAPLENWLYRVVGVRPAQEMSWTSYATALLTTNLLGFLGLYLLQRVQAVLPLNPQGLGNVSSDLAFNTAASFATNTNWQSYAGETTLSYLTQMVGVTVQNFMSAATGMAVLVAVTRGLTRTGSSTLGNFWVDFVRGILYILLPLSLILSLVFVSQGVVQTLQAYPMAKSVQPQLLPDGALAETQLLAVGPVASQLAIKQLGTNGGGFFGANSAHPFENPTPLSNLLEMLAILLIPAALCFSFGSLVGDARQGRAILAAMLLILVPLIGVAVFAEYGGNPAIARLGVDQAGGELQPGGNMEGKEVRFGIANSALWAVATGAASNGSVNSMLDSFTPLGGLVPLWLIQLGEVVFGGVGSGLYGMLMFATISVFVGGLMVGPDARIPGQEDRGIRDEDGLAGRPHPASPGPSRGGRRPGSSRGSGSHPGSRPPWPDRGALRLLLCGQQQRQRLRRTGYQSVVLQRDIGAGDALRALLADRAGAGVRRIIGCQEEGAGRSGNASHRLTGVRGATGRRRSIGGSPDVPAGPGARTDRRALPDGDAVTNARTKTSRWSDLGLLRRATLDALRKLDPRHQVRNPVMFVAELGAALVTAQCVQVILEGRASQVTFALLIAAWLWITVLFANFAEAMAEGRGKAQADSLRKTRQDVRAVKLDRASPDANRQSVLASGLRKGDIVLVEAGDVIPGDGEVVEGIASVDESAITGESAPVIRESGGDRSAVTGGTRVLSDWMLVRIGAEPGEGFLDRMISLVEGAKRQRTPNEIALNILLAALTIILLLATTTLLPFSIYSVRAAGQGSPLTVPVLVALLVCLIPTTIGGLLSAIGISGMDRLIQANVIALSGRAVEAAGDVDVLLLDKTGTITLGNRQAISLIPAEGISESVLADAAQLSSLADETPEGRSIVVLAKSKYGLRGRDIQELGAEFVPFTAQTRMSGVNLECREIRKGAPDAIRDFVESQGGSIPDSVQATVASVAREGGTPLVVADGPQVLGTVQLKDVVKGGMKERFAELRRMGIRTTMITGDNALTAAAIAAEAGVDDFLAQATPEAKLKLIREHQASGRLVAMTGDGTNDAPALAQADVAVAMNTGTQAAKEAGNMVDLDSNPTKLIEIVAVGKQLLMTRGALTTFSIANDISKYFAILPAAFTSIYPELGTLNIMRLATPQSAVLSAVIFNALIIVLLIPLALRGVRYRPMGSARLLRENVLVYGLGGLVTPFIGIKLIDILLVALGVS